MNKGCERSSHADSVNQFHADYKIIHVTGLYRFYLNHTIDFAIIIMAQLFV